MQAEQPADVPVQLPPVVRPGGGDLYAIPKPRIGERLSARLE